MLHTLLKPKHDLSRLALIGTMVAVGSFLMFSTIDFGHQMFNLFLPFEKQTELSLRPCLIRSSYGEQAICLREVLPRMFQARGVRTVMTAFENHVSKAGETFACHEAGHTLGEVLYADVKNVGEALALCTSVCHNGCQHGVVGAMFRSKKIEKESVDELFGSPSLVALCAKHNQTRGGYLLCLHGLGHAFMLARDGDLLPALRDCDALQLSETRAPWCWSGVFMENARNVFTGHNKAYVREGDPFFPCTLDGLDERYLRSCYNQLHFLSSVQAFPLCRQAPSQWREACAEGIGIAIASLQTDFLGAIVRRCELGLPDLKIPCLRGAFSYLAPGAQNGDPAEDKRIREYCDILGPEKAAVCYSLRFNDRYQ